MRVRFATGALVGVLAGAAGCGGSSGQPLPSTNAAGSAATRIELAEPEHPELRLHSIAETLTATTPKAGCTSDAKALVDAIASASAGPVSDPVLAELFADENATMAKLLTACEVGHGEVALLSSLDNVRGEVSNRLSADGVRTS